MKLESLVYVLDVLIQFTEHMQKDWSFPIQVMTLRHFLQSGCISQCLTCSFKIKSHLSLQLFPFPSSKLLFQITKPCTWKCNLFLESKHEIFQPSKHVLKLFKFLEEEWKLPVQGRLWHLQQCSGIGSAGGTQPWEKQPEASGSCSSPVRLQLDHRAALPIHLPQHPASFWSDCYPMVGVKHEKSLVCKLYPEMHLYLVSCICKTLSAFLLIRVTEYCWP